MKPDRMMTEDKSMNSVAHRIKRFIRRSETGQSLILLAIAFIALVAFVGITTDVAIMFVRYNQLSRAVDSAAIAAANQMRQDRSIASVRLAAHQFVEFYGVAADDIWVYTADNLDVPCSVQRSTLPVAERDELCTEQASKMVRVEAVGESPTVFMRLLGIQSFPLPVSAVSETAALDVVIVMDVSESMLRYTTIEEWARYAEYGYGPSGLGVIYRPPRVDEILVAKQGSIDGEALFWQSDGIAYPAGNSGPDGEANIKGLLNYPQQMVNDRLTYNVSTDADPAAVGAPSRDPDYLVRWNANYFNTAGYGPQAHPREDCRIRFYPNALGPGLESYYAYRAADGTLVDMNQMYASLPGLAWPVDQLKYNGFFPAYNFYGCCNDPNGDGNFEDLVCQPFKQARDATFEFLERIDFSRGDRVAFVTFDRTAFLVNPYGYIDENGNGTRDANENRRPGGMITNPFDADYVLRNLVGVRAEPNFYEYEPGIYNPTAVPSGSWAGFAAGLRDDGTSIAVDFSNRDPGYNPEDGSNPLTYNYPVFNNCAFDNAAQYRMERTMYDFGLHNASLPPATDPQWKAYTTPIDGNALYSGNFIRFGMSYEYRAGCRGTNIGAALREANNALVNPETVRRFGTVWVVVMLSDGGAGATDPVRRNRDLLAQSEPYQPVGGGQYGVRGEYGAYGICPYGTPSNPGELVLTDGAYDSAGNGDFPYCSDEAPITRQECNFRPFIDLNPTRFADPLGATISRVVNGETRTIPAMGDSRYLFFGEVDANGNGPASVQDEPFWNRQNNRMYDLDLSSCSELYDVDDYARDWADYVGLDGITEQGGSQLPTIFTIGFGLEFRERDNGSGGTLDVFSDLPDVIDRICSQNPGDCLGEQLLRYIADVGDNNRIDNDYYQDVLEERLQNGGALDWDGFMESGNFGPRDPCQNPTVGPIVDATGTYYADPEDAYSPLRAQTSCGNYFFAPDGNELQLVFDEIASRMFTRLNR